MTVLPPSPGLPQADALALILAALINAELDLERRCAGPN